MRQLYERLLERTQHVKVWISYAKFEFTYPPEDTRVVYARKVLSRANQNLRSCEEKEQRKMLLEEWKDFEDKFGDDASLQKVMKLMPKKVNKRKLVTSEDGNKSNWEEYIEYVFPDDEAAKPSLLFLAKAKEWMKKQKENDGEEDEDVDNEDEVTKNKEIIDRDLDRDDSEVEIGTTSSDSSSSDSEEESKERKSSKSKKYSKRNKESSESSSSDDESKSKNKRPKRSNSSNSSSSSSSSDSSSDEKESQKKSMDLYKFIENVRQKSEKD